MAPVSMTFAGGLLMGLASSLHCAGMCGAIASSLMFAFAPGESSRTRTRTLLIAQSGRILVYVLGGALLGAAGAAFYGAFDHPAAYLAMRWAAAVALGWIGFSVIGLAPSLAGVDRFTAPISRALHSVKRSAGLNGAGTLVSGMIWGLLPCGMVYGALFYAMLSGGALGGAEVMLGFGLGTLPSVTAVALGMSGIRKMANLPKARVIVGLAIMAVAAASLAVPAAAIAALCAP